MTIHLQEWNYPNEKISFILPFLADGILVLVLGGMKCEGNFRAPGDGDLVSELKLRIDRGYYTLENVNDPHVLASLKLWLHKLCDPLIPEELHNDCINASPYPPALCYSFFLEEKVLASTKMTAANMALVLAPNLQIYQSSTAENGLSNTTCTSLLNSELLLDSVRHRHMHNSDATMNYGGLSSSIAVSLKEVPYVTSSSDVIRVQNQSLGAFCIVQENGGVLADGPNCFWGCHDTERVDPEGFVDELTVFDVTNLLIQVSKMQGIIPLPLLAGWLDVVWL
ncbi:Rho GTPase activation protein [Pisolithus marmoratus]|nr:Rho GTPase activation protein [Pisolithus marmoratus]